MKRYAMAGLAAGAAMMIGGVLAAVSNNNSSRAVTAPHSDVMNPMIACQAMSAERNLLDNMTASPDHAALAAAMNKSGIADALTSNGQFTVFGPVNSAMASIPAQVLDDKARLARLMGYLVVPGKYDSQALLKAIGEGGGHERLRTVEGDVLLAQMNGPTNVILVDASGNTADISIYDVYNRNGVLHVVDRMLQPGASAPQVAKN
jgi:uncharacterized surface protein with fasciclin (FAS1) repeats